MADPKGFLTVREREIPPYRPVAVRLLDWKEVRELRADSEPDAIVLNRQASRCMNCGIPFCHSGCPLGNLIPEFNDLVWREQWADASDRLHATNNFPDFTGRLCPAPCETSCVLGINQPAVTIKNIEVSIAEQAFDRDLLEPQTPQWLTGHTVAVIGSGPAGLAAAQQLTRAGHTVAVYERADRIGGLMRYGIPEFKMEKAVIDRRLAQMEAEGTRFYPSTAVGVDISGADLRSSYDAVVVATGSTIPRDLPVPGRELDGVLQAMDFLVPANKVAVGDVIEGQVTAQGKHVVVIGGGDTGADCLGTALRQGAASVTQLEIMPQPPEDRPESQPWPTYPMIYRVASAHEEGGERVYSVSTTQIVGDGEGRVSALRLVEVEMVGGRFTPIEGSEVEIPAQLVLLAMGFVGAETPVLQQLELDVNERGSAVRTDDFATTIPGVFVAGDAGRGQSLIVWAIAEGRAAAAAVDTYLQGATQLPSPVTASTVSVRV